MPGFSMPNGSPRYQDTAMIATLRKPRQAFSVLDAGIYEIVHVASGRRYIGSSRNVRYRLQRHRCDLRGGRARSRYLQNVWNKYGEDAFAFRQVLACSEDHLTLFEDILISGYQTRDKRFGFNHRVAADTNAGMLRVVSKTVPGVKFGRLTAIEPREVVGTDRKWLFRCDCGREKMIFANLVRRGRQISCGCWRRIRNAGGLAQGVFAFDAPTRAAV